MEASRAVIEHALDAGITLFDTADSYGNEGGSEKALGAFLGPRRKNIVLATKFGLGGGGSRRHVMAACEASLKRLNTDWIDFYQLHRPDPRTPIEETLRALDDLVHQGKVRGDRLLQPFGRAGGRSAGDVAARQACVVRVVPGRVQPARAGNRDGAGAGDRAPRPDAAALLPARERHAHRKIPARRGSRPPGSRLARISNHADRYLNDANFVIVEKLEAFATARGP